MKFPRVRFTVRRIIVALAVVAVGPWLPSFATASYRNYVILRQLHRHPPVALDLWHGRVAPGDDVERVVTRTLPHCVTRRGPFVRLLYYPGGPPPPGSLSMSGTCIIAKNGVLVSAASWECTFQHTYFDLMSARENAEFSRLLDEYPGRQPELGDRP
jgi:hypothetical protein